MVLKVTGVMVGSGEVLSITHLGQAHVGTSHSKLILKDVIVIPDIKKDLLSISKLTSNFPFTIQFDGFGFVIKDKTIQR